MAPASVRTRRASCSTIDDSTMSGGSLSYDLWQEVGREEGKHCSGGGGGGGGGGDDNEKDLVTYRDPVAPRSRRTVRRSVSVAEEASNDGSTRGAALSAWSALRSSPSFEVLHPLQTLRLEREAEFNRNPTQNTLSNTLDQPQSAKVHEELTEAVSEEENEETSQENLQLAIVPVAPANVVVIIVDAERKPTTGALDWALKVVIQPGDEVVILGVLKHIHSPNDSSAVGHKMLADVNQFIGVNETCLRSETRRKLEALEKKLSDSGRREECESKQVKLTARIAPGANPRSVVVRELRSLQASWAIFDRHVMKDRKFYAKYLSCHIVRMRRGGRSPESISPVSQEAHHKFGKRSHSDISCASSSVSSASASSDYTSSDHSPSFWSRISHLTSSRRSYFSSSSSSSPGPSPRTVLPPQPPSILTTTTTTTTTKITTESKCFDKLQDEEPFSLDLSAAGLDKLSMKLRSFYLGMEDDDNGDEHLDMGLNNSCGSTVDSHVSKLQGFNAQRRQHHQLTLASAPPISAS